MRVRVLLPNELVLPACNISAAKHADQPSHWSHPGPIRYLGALRTTLGVPPAPSGIWGYCIRRWVAIGRPYPAFPRVRASGSLSRGSAA